VPARTAAAWDAEPAFARDVAAERAFDAAVESEQALLRERRLDAAIELWEGLQDRLATTCLSTRVQARLSDRATSWRFRDANR
jgi:hypothetical protein